MPVLRSTALIYAPLRAVAGLLRDSEVVGEALRRVGHRFHAPTRLLRPGDEVRIATRVAPAVRIPVRMVVEAVSEAGTVSVLRTGHLRALVHAVTLTPTAAGTLVLDEVRWTSPLGPVRRVADVVLVRRLVRRLLAARSQMLVQSAAALVDAPVVVATALHRDGRLLVAQRTRPTALAGRWELPGGRVEAGESEPEAVVRECLEELGVPVHVAGRLGTDLPIDAGVLRVYIAELAAGAPEPQALEHAELRWVGPSQIEEMDWLDADRAVAADLVALLAAAAARVGQ